MLLGYNTNGLAQNEPLAAIDLLAAIGYRSVALSIDHHLLNPFSDTWTAQLKAIGRLLEKHGMSSVIETGARYLLDPTVKHEPTLVSASASDRQRRVQFLKHAIDVARALDSDCVSLWSGTLHDAADERTMWDRLVSSLTDVIDYAAKGRTMVPLGFEPEPGMVIETMDRYVQLADRIQADHFRLTLDVGHLHCQGEIPIAKVIERFAPRLANVHIEDMRAGVHEHLMFGEGEMDFPPIIAALSAAGYQGGLHVELSRHGQVGPQAARQAFEFLQPLVSRA